MGTSREILSGIRIRIQSASTRGLRLWTCLPGSPVAQEGFEPSASLGLNESGLPVAYRALAPSRRQPWDSNPQAARGRRLFSRQFPDPAGWLPSVLASRQVPGAGIEPAASTFRAWRHDQPQLPRSVPRLLFGQNTFRSVQVREGGFEPPPPESKSGSLPVSRFPRVPRGS